MANNTVTLMGGGDTGPVVEPTDKFAEFILPVLRQADLRFAQCERTYSERGWLPHYEGEGHSGGHSRLHPRLASIWKTAGIDIVSMATNHGLDWGPEAMLDTIEMFQGMGMHVIGAGKNDKEARTPAIVERNGVKIAFLAYCSLLRYGQASGPGKAGVAPMRAHIYYAAEDYRFAPPRIFTVPYEQDLKALQEDIKKAKQEADVVVISLHWGISQLPKAISPFQPVVAHAAIDAGADLILGHGPHVLKAVEVYKGKVCFYSIGNFLTTGPLKAVVPVKWGLWWYHIDPECMPPRGMYPFSSDCRKTMIAKAVLSKKGVERVSFLPAYISPQAQPAVVPPSDSKFQEILEYMEWVSDQHPHKFRVENEEIVVDTQA